MRPPPPEEPDWRLPPSSAMALMHYLGIAMVRETAGAGRRRLKRIEDLHEDLKDLD